MFCNPREHESSTPERPGSNFALKAVQPELKITGGEFVKKTLLCFLVFTLASATALFGADRLAVAHATHIIKGKQIQLEPVTQHKIFSNVGPSTNEYQANGYFVAGPTNPVLGHSQFMAVPFTLGTTGYTLSLVKVPMQWYGQGHNLAQLCLYSDNSGVPGSQIGKCVQRGNLPAFGTTNTLTTYNFTTQGLKLSASTAYWIVGQTPSSGAAADATMVWCAESIYEGDNISNGGWGAFQPDLESVAAIYGQ
jgi:hypothetical protein